MELRKAAPRPPLTAAVIDAGRSSIRDHDTIINKAFAMYDVTESGRMDAKNVRICRRSMGVLVDQHDGDEVRRPASAFALA